MATTPATQPTDADPVAYCAELPTARRRGEGAELLDLFGAVTGTAPVMWGPSLIGYGTFEYHYASGHSGSWFPVGFSPRKAALSLYGLQGFDGAQELLERLGKHRLGAGCVYVNGLADVDPAVLRRLVERAWSHHLSANS